MEQIDEIVNEIREKKSYLIGIAGIPGSGKSHYSQILKEKLGNAMIVPMDGFHLYRKDLTEEGVRFRGAAFTFNLKSFKDKVELLSKRQAYPLKFPSFDHALKDPIEESIIIK
jgi:pantothenate kinase